MNDLEYSPLLFPNFIVKNKKGEVVLKLKRKEDNDRLYYLFEKHSLPNKAWRVITSLANRMDIPLYDIEEVKSRLKQKLDEEKHIDNIEIKIVDHATMDVHTVTIKITRPS